MRKISIAIISLIVISSFVFCFTSSVRAEGKTIDVFLFEKEGCQYCASTKALFDTFTKMNLYPGLVLHEVSVLEKDGAEKFVSFCAAYDSVPDAVPKVFIGEKVINGFAPETIRQELDACNNTQCANPEEYVQSRLDAKANPVKEPIRISSNTFGWALGILAVLGGAFYFYKKLLA